ncbi:atlastin [Ditylenchus destructor]|nr:atlastin [Ditylenchus destructor]
MAIQGDTIVVVSVAGAYRQGKSFLLNIFLRYLQLSSTGNPPEKGWLKQGGPLQGFESRNGTDGCTKGIWAYPDLFVFTLNDGSEVAVMLVDCQGAFDNHANPEECAMVFTFSMLMSSVQIYNVNGRIQRDNLENLQLFVAYGKLAAGDGKRLQAISEIEGGKKYLLKELSSHGQSSQLQDVKEFVWETFEDVECYLMPHPGQSVALGRSDYMSKMEDEFAEHAERLTESLLHPDVLVPKRVAGQEITGSQLIDLLESYAKALENGNCIDASTILQIKATFCNNELQKELFAEYKDLLAECLESDPWASTQPGHEAVKATVFNKFDLAKKLGGDEMAAKHRDELETNIEKTFAEARKFLGMQRELLLAEKHSELIQTYNSLMAEFINAAPANVPIDSNQLSQKHQQCYQAAVKPFEERIEQYRSGTTDYDFGPALEQLNRDITAAYNSFVNQNNQRTEKIQAKKAAEESEKRRREAERAVDEAIREKGYAEDRLQEERDRARQDEQRRQADLKERKELVEQMAKQHNEQVNQMMAAQEAKAEQIRQEQKEMQEAAERRHQEQLRAMRNSKSKGDNFWGKVLDVAAVVAQIFVNTKAGKAE